MQATEMFFIFSCKDYFACPIYFYLPCVNLIEFFKKNCLGRLFWQVFCYLNSTSVFQTKNPFFIFSLKHDKLIVCKYL